MKRLIFIASLLVIAGCDGDNVNRQECIREVTEAYCHPYQTVSGIRYDCSGVNNPAYDAAIKACIETTKR